MSGADNDTTRGDAATTRRLILERRSEDASTGDLAPGVQMTPAIGEDFWSYRVRLSDEQAILGFPKFGTIGIGFAVEEDWNSNLPYTSGTQEIYDHIAHNKGDDDISENAVLNAIGMVQQAAREERTRAAVLRGLHVLELMKAGHAVHSALVHEMAMDLRRIGRHEGILDSNWTVVSGSGGGS